MLNTHNRHTELHTLLTQLNLAGMVDTFADLALRAAKEGLSHEAYLYELARIELEQRTQRRTSRLVRASGLPGEKTFRTFSLNRLTPTLQLQVERLKSASFLETATNVIAIGKPGVGKSHCLAAVGYELIYAVLDANQCARPTTPGGEAGFASAAGTGEIGQILLCDSRRYWLCPA